MFGLSRFATYAIGGMAALILLGLAFYIHGNNRYGDGYARCEAQWQAASARTEAAARDAIDKADTMAAGREQQHQQQIEELRDEARKGDDTVVGPGVSATLARLRQQQARRSGNQAAGR